MNVINFKSLPKGIRSSLLFMIGFSILLNVLILCVPIYAIQIYQLILPSHSIETLLSITAVVLVALTLYAILTSARMKILIGISAWFETEVMSKLSEKMVDEVLDQGDYPYQLSNDVQSVSTFLTSNAFIALLDLPWTPLFFIAIFVLHTVLGLFSIGVALGIIALVIFNEKLLAGKVSQFDSKKKEMDSLWYAILRNAEMLQGMGIVKNIDKKWCNSRDETLELKNTIGQANDLMASATKYIRLAAQILILGLGAYLAILGEIGSGAVIAASILMSKALQPIEVCISSWKQFIQNRAAWKRLQLALKKPVSRLEPKRPLPPKGDIDVENLTFVFPKTKQIVLKQVSFQVKSGRMIAVVGPSGSGKTTLCRLMLGILKPAMGRVLLDGLDIYHTDRSDLGEHLGYLPQDIELFPGSIQENISRFGSMNHDEVVRAAKFAGAEEMILRLPGGFDTHISKGGTGISQGQLQRVALARSLFGDPRVVFLDEPDSNLDEEGELALMDTLNRLKEKKVTTLIISHRMKALHLVDDILVMSQGGIKKFGPKEEVLNEFHQNTRKKSQPQVIQT